MFLNRQEFLTFLEVFVVLSVTIACLLGPVLLLGWLVIQ